VRKGKREKEGERVKRGRCKEGEVKGGGGGGRAGGER